MKNLPQLKPAEVPKAHNPVIRDNPMQLRANDRKDKIPSTHGRLHGTRREDREGKAPPTSPTTAYSSNHSKKNSGRNGRSLKKEKEWDDVIYTKLLLYKM